jgi:hypothetical protein
MHSIHFVCRDRANLYPVKPPVYDSGDWDVTPEDGARLTGGMIYLHQTKAALSYFGGKIDSYRITETDNAHPRRIIFTFTYMPEGRGAKWRGGVHARAWTSGVVED